MRRRRRRAWPDSVLSEAVPSGRTVRFRRWLPETCRAGIMALVARDAAEAVLRGPLFLDRADLACAGEGEVKIAAGIVDAVHAVEGFAAEEVGEDGFAAVGRGLGEFEGLGEGV